MSSKLNTTNKSLSFYTSNIELPPLPPCFVAGPRGGVRDLRPRPAARPVRQPRAAPLRRERRHRAPAAGRRAAGRGKLFRRGARGVGAGVRLQGASLVCREVTWCSVRCGFVVGKVVLVWSAAVRCDMSVRWCLGDRRLWVRCEFGVGEFVACVVRSCKV